jgi:hypothetical protein
MAKRPTCNNRILVICILIAKASSFSVPPNFLQHGYLQRALAPLENSRQLSRIAMPVSGTESTWEPQKNTERSAPVRLPPLLRRGSARMAMNSALNVFNGQSHRIWPNIQFRRAEVGIFVKRFPSLSYSCTTRQYRQKPRRKRTSSYTQRMTAAENADDDDDPEDDDDPSIARAVLAIVRVTSRSP